MEMLKFFKPSLPLLFTLLLFSAALSGHEAIAASETLATTEAPTQGSPETQATSKAIENEILSPETSTSDLELLLMPLQKEELEKYTEQWVDMTQEKVGQYVELVLKVGPDQAIDSELKQEVLDYVKRGQIFVDSLKEKSGKSDEVEEYEKYFSEVGKMGMQIGGPKAWLIEIKNWLFSKQGGWQWVKNLLIFGLVLLVFWFLGGIVARGVNKSLKRYRLSRALKNQLTKNIKRIVIFLGVLAGLAVIGIPVTPLLAALGALGLIIGLALQSTLSSLFCGIMILLYRPFDIEDVVKVDNVFGKIEAINLMTTTLTTFDNQRVHVPNEKIWGNVISNLSGKPTRRVDMVFGISYSDDLAKTQKILEEIVAAHPMVLKDPAPIIKLHELADSSVNFIVRPWVKTPDYWEVYWDITRQVKEKFDAEQVSIPFPQRDVHLIQKG